MSLETYSWIGLFIMLFSVVLGITGELGWAYVGLVWIAVFVGSILLGIIRGLIKRRYLESRFKRN